jgi:hypothetical protein
MEVACAALRLLKQRDLACEPLRADVACRRGKSQLTVRTNAEVVCVDGVGGVEAVVVRYARTGRLCAVNTSAFLSCNSSTPPPCTRLGDMPLENRKIEPERGEMLETGWHSTRPEVESPERDSGRERLGFEMDADQPQVVAKASLGWEAGVFRSVRKTPINARVCHNPYGSGFSLSDAFVAVPSSSRRKQGWVNLVTPLL